MNKCGRNDPCPCGSGKKFKKCCETKMLGKKFIAEKIETGSSLTSLFRKVTTMAPKKNSEEK
jgi:hypothetical protein